MNLTLPETQVGVVDLGGGSTEIVVGDLDKIHRRSSMEIGTVRLTETVCGHPPETFSPEQRDEMVNQAREVVSALPWPYLPDQFIAVAGTATTLAAAELGLDEWDAQRVHGFWLERDALDAWIRRLVGCSRAQRKAWFAVSPERADTVLAGACILSQVCAAAQTNGLRISVGGIRHGLVAAASFDVS